MVRNHFGDLGVDGWIILGWICREKGCIGSWCGNRRERDHWGPWRGWVDNVIMDLLEEGGV